MSSSLDTDKQGYSQIMTIGDYFSILKRRIWSMIIPFVLVITIGALLAFLLPSVYRSEATILIERQEIPNDLVETTVTGYVQERIEGISKRLLTRDNIWGIAQKLELYPENLDQTSRFDVVTEIRDSILVEMIDVNTSEPDNFRQGVATIAFTVAFEADNPEIAKEVTDELATLYIEQNKLMRSEHAEEVSEFLNAEGERLNKQITELESKLAVFKQDKQSILPENMELNLQLFEKTGNEIERTKEEVSELEDKIAALQAEMAITKPYQDVVDGDGKKILTGDERLSVLTAEYLRLSSRYSAQHPDSIKLRREIEALGGNKNVSGVATLIRKLEALKAQLSEARRNYSEDHPDVASLRQAISAVERGLQTASVSPNNSSKTSKSPDNPQYVSIRTQLNSSQGNLRSARTKIIQLNGKLDDYEKRLFETPAVERDYKLLTRDYEIARKKYDEIKDKQSEARLAIDLESSSKGERFVIVQPAFLPNSPERPNRLGILLISFLMASAAGLGVVAVREYMDDIIHNANDLTAVLRAPPLVSIPYIAEQS